MPAPLEAKPPVPSKSLRSRAFAIAALTLAAIVVPVAGASSAPQQGKDFAMVVEHQPAQWAGATDSSYEITLTNNTGTQQLGSANITVPQQLAITDRNNLGGSGRELQLRNIAVPAGASLTVTLGLRMPCAGAIDAWQVVAKQSNDFSGEGNSLTLQREGTVLNTPVQGTCKLRFASQPASAAKGAEIRAHAFQPVAGDPVAVEARDARPVGATRTASFNGSVSLTSNPSALPLISAQASAGLATFSAPGLKIPASGNYTLRATAAGLAPADSAGFQVIDVVRDCKPSRCAAELPGSSAKSDIALSGAPDSGTGFALASLNLGGDPLAPDTGCAGYAAPTEDHFEFGLFGFAQGVTGSKQVVLSYSKDAMRRRGPSSLEICLGVPGPVGFTAKDGAPAKPFDYDGDGLLAEGFAGLLPDCPRSPSETCVLGRRTTSGGGASITLFDPTLADPRMH